MTLKEEYVITTLRYHIRSALTGGDFELAEVWRRCLQALVAPEGLEPPRPEDSGT